LWKRIIIEKIGQREREDQEKAIAELSLREKRWKRREWKEGFEKNGSSEKSDQDLHLVLSLPLPSLCRRFYYSLAK